MSGAPRTSRSLLASRLRTAAAAFSLASLAACANWPAQDDTPDTGELLRNSLPVAAAALAAGQLNVARRLYLSLSERFDNAPEPYLGLGYIAFQSGDFPAAENYFLKAAERAADTPALQAEALLGAGRTALVQGNPAAAQRHFRAARAPGQDTPAAAWIANGLAVVSALDAEFEAAETHYAEALRLSSGNPRIAANFIRMLVAAGRIDDAARAYAQHPPSHWPDDDGAALSRLIDESRRQRRAQALARPRAVLPDAAAADDFPARDDAASGRTGDGASPLRESRAAPARLEGEVRDHEVSRPLDPNLAMRLYLSDALPAQAGEDAGLSAEVPPRDRSGLMFHLDRWPDPSTPPEQNATGSGAIAPAPGSTPPQSDSTARASDPEAPRSPSTAPASASSQADSAAPASEPAARQSHTTASAPEPEAPQPDSTAPASALSGPERPTAPSPSATAISGAALPHPLPESGAPALTSLDHSPPTTLTLTLGQSRRLHLERDATTVLVASPEVADVQLLAPNVLYVIGKGIGRTSVAVLDENKRIEERVVAVVLDLEPLRTILAGEPDLHGVRARRLSRGMALTGEVPSAASADRALRLAAGALPEGVQIENELQIAAPQQVNLEVQIAEVHRSVTEDLGVNWEAFRIRGDEVFGFQIGRVIGGFPQPPLTDAAGRVLPSALAGFPPTPVGGQLSPAFSFGRATGNTRIGAMIDALATAGLANVLARPNLTAVSGESASFFSGGERPLPTGYDSKTETILFEYKKVGVLLDFVPTVVDPGRILLTVRPEVSEPDASQPLAIGPVLLPVINVRRAETTVEVGDGESIVIAGLFSNRSSTTESGLPGLKDVPLLGLLFGTTSVRSNELELIVIVTARLVQAYETPGDTSAPAATLQANGYHY